MTAAELQQISVDLSVNVGDEVGLYTTDGSQFLAAARTNAINQARGRVYSERLKPFLDNVTNSESERRAYVQFANAWITWKKKAAGTSVNASGQFTVPADSKRILEIYVLPGREESPGGAKELPVNDVINSITNTFSYHYPTATKHKYVQFESIVQLYPADYYSGGNIDVDVIYLASPVAVALTVAVPDPFMWRDEILLFAEDILMGRQQKRNVA